MDRVRRHGMPSRVSANCIADGTAGMAETEGGEGIGFNAPDHLSDGNTHSFRIEIDHSHSLLLGGHRSRALWRRRDVPILYRTQKKAGAEPRPAVRCCKTFHA